ncbi:MAG: hypothetical protein M3R47_08800 [Chloroflexota bacterium]|nr:hypothetical protein [Chloroflexota bacterium]
MLTFRIGDELRSHLNPSGMKPYLPDWKRTLENLRFYWAQGEATTLETPFVEWIDGKKPNKFAWMD